MTRLSLTSDGMFRISATTLLTNTLLALMLCSENLLCGHVTVYGAPVLPQHCTSVTVSPLLASFTMVPFVALASWHARSICSWV